MNILAVDDHDGSASMFQLYLELVHETAEIAISVEQAEQILAVKPFDALIFDYLLRGSQTGLDLLRWCRANGVKAPTAIVTAVAPDQIAVIEFAIVTEGLEPAVVLSKPAEPEVLLKTLKAMVKGV